MNPPAMPAATMKARTITGHRLPAAAAGIGDGTLSSSRGTAMGELRMRWPAGHGRGRAAAATSRGFVGSGRPSR